MSDITIQRSPLSSLSKDTMNTNTAFGSNRMATGFKPETVNNVLVVEQPEIIVQKQSTNCYGNWINYLFWFVIIAIIAWFLLFSLRPEIVLRRHRHHHSEHHSEHGHSERECNESSEHGHYRYGEVDQARVLAGAVIIGLIGIFVIWLFQWGCGSKY